jgi:thiosulfate dehydrogenase (quinone) large subunit
MIGLRTRESLFSGAVLLPALTLGTTLRQDWDVAGIRLLYSVVYAVLMAGLGYNVVSVDAEMFGVATGDMERR